MRAFACLLSFLCGAVLLSACSNDDVNRPKGELEIEWADVGGARTLSRDAKLDFGPVFSGQAKKGTLIVVNRGSGSLTLSSLTVVDGDPTAIGEGGDGTPVFEVAFTAGKILGPAESWPLEVTFHPPISDQPTTDHHANLTLTVENASADASTARIALSGRSISGRCELPARLDFGNVLVDHAETQSFTFTNPTEISVVAFAGTVEGADLNAFSYDDLSPQGDIPVPPGENEEVTLSFHPSEARGYLAHIKARASADCPEGDIQLVGAGVDSLLSWAPKQLDFGYVPPPLSGTQTLTFTNIGNKDVQITNIRSDSPTEFIPAQTSLTVPARGGTVGLDVAFQAGIVGPRFGKLSFNTSLETQASGAETMVAFSGGPDIDVKPAAVNFGKVAWFPNAGTPTAQSRHIVILNLGSKKSPELPDGNLMLGDPAATVVPANDTTEADEFSVSLSPKTPYDPAVGLPPEAGKNLVELEVTLTPKSLGQKQATVTISSNDLDEPSVTVTVTANVVSLPPCNYQVSPTTIDYGVVAPPDYKDLSFNITNLSQNPGDVCLISDLRLEVTSDSAFSLPDGEIAERELQPGETLEVKTRVWPQTSTSSVQAISGNVHFYASTPTKPEASVSLAATVTASCVTVAPDEQDYGTVKVGCNSVTRTVSVYNACPTAVTLDSISVVSGAGQPAGGPNCSGTSPCPEFQLVQTPAIPSGGLTLPANSSAVTFQTKYTPIDYGTDSGVVGVHLTVNGQALLYTVVMEGKGDAMGIQHDVFTTGGTPMADILLTIDGSCSMASKQNSLAVNMPAFFSYAMSAGVNYRIAVIDGQGPGSNSTVGEFLQGPTHPDRILTPTTPNVQTQFEEKVKVGANGGDEQCFEPSLEALTGPLATTTNANFLRQNAPLSIICITDDQDYSPNTVAYYLAALTNIKGASQKTLFSLSAIAAFQNICNVSRADDGRYASMVASTGGVKEEICAPDWAKSLQKISQVAFGARGTFYLTAPPDLTQGSIDVKVDGVTISSTSSNGQTVWSYDSVSNAVAFDPLYRPGAGSTVEFTYPMMCF